MKWKNDCFSIPFICVIFSQERATIEDLEKDPYYAGMDIDTLYLKTPPEVSGAKGYQETLSDLSFDIVTLGKVDQLKLPHEFFHHSAVTDQDVGFLVLHQIVPFLAGTSEEIDWGEVDAPGLDENQLSRLWGLHLGDGQQESESKDTSSAPTDQVNSIHMLP